MFIIDFESFAIILQIKIKIIETSHVVFVSKYLKPTAHNNKTKNNQNGGASATVLAWHINAVAVIRFNVSA